jgi:putative thiamine transport system ATP-binding protein
MSAAENAVNNVAGLELIDVSLSVNDTPLISHLNQTIKPGEILTLMGASGSGKSSLLAMIAGVLPAAIQSTGSVRLNGRTLDGLPAAERRVGLLFQDPLLFPHMSVGENLAFAVPQNIRGRARWQSVEAALAQADMQGFGDRDPATLSGGQQSRVSLLRTLLAQPQALLLDEPYSSLDQALRENFRTYIQGLVKSSELPTLLVTHDPDDAPTGGRVLHMADLIAGN